jgi:transposase
MRAHGVAVTALQQVRRAAAPHRRAGHITETALSTWWALKCDDFGCLPADVHLVRVLAGVELSAAGRQYADTVPRRIDELTVEIEPVRGQLVSFAGRQVGCQALQSRQYEVGWLCAAIMWAEIGDARRFSRSDQLVRFAGLDVTVYSSADKRTPGHLSRQGSPELRWATFEAAN